MRFKRFPLTPSFHCKRNDKAIHSSSGCPMREAKNPQLEMSTQPQIQRRVQANTSLFHFISLAEQSGHCNDAKRQFVFQNPSQGRVHFHHDTRPLKTGWVTLPPLQTKPHGGTTPSLVIGFRIKNCLCILLNILESIYLLESFT